MKVTRKIKPIAAGLLEDIGRLLKDFLETNSLEFSDFAAVWRKHNFSLIFSGRINDNELTEFTHEAFRTAGQFLSTLSLPYEVGTIFLLYALFRNQISKPPIMIRIEYSQWEIISRVREKAIMHKYRSLHYVIDYLIKNALQFVGRANLRGPNINAAPKSSEVSEAVSTLKASYKNQLTDLCETTSLTDLGSLLKEYASLKSFVKSDVKLNQTSNPEIFDKIYSNYNSLLDETGNSELSQDNIGRRRAEIKKAAFSNKSTDFWRRNFDSEDSVDDIFEESAPEESSQSQVKRKGRGRGRGRGRGKKHRRVGRPCKNDPIKEESSEEENGDMTATDKMLSKDIDIVRFRKQQEEMCQISAQDLAKLKRTAKFPTFERSPKRDEYDSDFSDY